MMGLKVDGITLYPGQWPSQVIAVLLLLVFMQ
jgi:hypothetical protein